MAVLRAHGRGPGMKAGGRGEEGGLHGSVGHKTELGLFSQINGKLLRSFKQRSDLIRVTFLKAHPGLQRGVCVGGGGGGEKPAAGGGSPGKGVEPGMGCISEAASMAWG